MHRTFEHAAKARLSFLTGHALPLNMVDSMENAGSWTVSVSKEVMEVQKNFKDLQKLGVRNIAQYNAANVPFPVCFHRHSLLPYYLPCLQERVAHQRN